MKHKTYVEIAEFVKIPYRIVKDNWEAESKEQHNKQILPEKCKDNKGFLAVDKRGTQRTAANAK